jgi:hypothetical protein
MRKGGKPWKLAVMAHLQVGERMYADMLPLAYPYSRDPVIAVFLLPMFLTDSSGGKTYEKSEYYHGACDSKTP